MSTQSLPRIRSWHNTLEPGVVPHLLADLRQRLLGNAAVLIITDGGRENGKWVPAAAREFRVVVDTIVAEGSTLTLVTNQGEEYVLAQLGPETLGCLNNEGSLFWGPFKDGMRSTTVLA